MIGEEKASVAIIYRSSHKMAELYGPAAIKGMSTAWSAYRGVLPELLLEHTVVTLHYKTSNGTL